MTSISRRLSPAILLLAASCQTAPLKEAVPLPKDQPPQPVASPAPTVSAATPAPSPAPDSSGKITTSSGLQYRVLASGPADGRTPSFFDSVMVHYRGTLTDGTVFDSSIERGVPATFGVGQVIAGWSEALRLMKPGDQWELFIPARLAYGNRAVGDKIPPNSDLIFKVALLQIVGS
jgi:FKBP-type peptidyl-prolyl cis-trans isomerase FklB